MTTDAHQLAEFLGRKPLILLVDDEGEMLALLGSEFQDAGFDVVTANNVKQAIELIRQKTIDVVLSDVRMPGGSGLDFLQQLKIFGVHRPHFVFMSAFSDLQVSEAYDYGANGFLTKPFQIQKAIELVSYLIGPRVQNWAQPYQGKLPGVQLHKVLKSNSLEAPSSEFRLGKGGFFIALEAHEIPKSRELVSFKIEFPNHDIPAFQGIGKVRWVRNRTAGEYPSGCGIEILHLIESSREQIIAYLEKFKPDSIIPAS